MHQMIQNAAKSIEAQEQRRKDYEAEIKAYQAETQRIAAVQAGMSPEQIQDIVMGTIAAALDTGDLVGGELEPREMPGQEEPGEMPEQMPQQGMMPNEMQ